MTLGLLKLVLTPLMIAMPTLAARRWGPIIGGLLVGLPLTSGPVSVFLAIEQGREFAAQAAHSAMLGSLAVTVFCVAYARGARVFAWPGALTLALTGYVLLFLLLSQLTLSLFPATVLVLSLTGIALRVVKPTEKNIPPPAPAHWDLPFRMIVATAIVFAITAASSHLGPRLSGLLSNVPVFICVMSVFSHRLQNAVAAQQLLRGIILANFAYMAFYLMVSMTIRILPLLLVYTLAGIAAIAVNWGVYRLVVQKSRLFALFR